MAPIAAIPEDPERGVDKVSRLVTWDQCTHFGQFVDQITGLDLEINRGVAGWGETRVEPSRSPLRVVENPHL